MNTGRGLGGTSLVVREDGEVFEADHVVSTTPLGALKSETIQFEVSRYVEGVQPKSFPLSFPKVFATKLSNRSLKGFLMWFLSSTKVV